MTFGERMKNNTNPRKKLPKKIARLILEDNGALKRIAGRVRRRDGRYGVSISMVSHVLAGRKRSRLIEAAILREAVLLEKRRCFYAADRIEDIARQIEV